MDKDFLKGLGLSDEDADKALAEHQKTVAAKDSEVTKLKGDLSQKETAFTNLKKKLDTKKKKSDDADDGKGEDNELQEKYDALSETSDILKRKNAESIAELTAYKNKDIVRKAGVHDKLVDYAVFEITRNLKEGDEFTKAAEDYVKANPGFKIAPGISSPDLSNGGGNDDTITAAARKGAGLPAKED